MAISSTNNWIMLVVYMSAFVVLATSVFSIEDSVHRSKRNAVSLAKLIGCTTNVTEIFTLYDILGKYGCYCGLGGQGEPVDDIDRCCKEHDHCYDAAENNDECWDWQTYVSIYKYITYHCGDNKPIIKCKSQRRCAAAMCECDSAIAMCLKEKWETYDDKYKFYHDSEQCKESDNVQRTNDAYNNDNQVFT